MSGLTPERPDTWTEEVSDLSATAVIRRPWEPHPSSATERPEMPDIDTASELRRRGAEVARSVKTSDAQDQPVCLFPGFDRDWVRSMGGLARQSACFPLDRSRH